MNSHLEWKITSLYNLIWQASQSITIHVYQWMSVYQKLWLIGDHENVLIWTYRVYTGQQFKSKYGFEQTGRSPFSVQMKQDTAAEGMTIYCNRLPCLYHQIILGCSFLSSQDSMPPYTAACMISCTADAYFSELRFIITDQFGCSTSWYLDVIKYTGMVCGGTEPWLKGNKYPNFIWSYRHSA